MNNLNIIIPYKWEGMWVFDDPRVGLDKEPFVSGADDMIDILVINIPKADLGFRLLFSAGPCSLTEGLNEKLDIHGFIRFSAFVLSFLFNTN
jgi:hypothetical protein